MTKDVLLTISGIQYDPGQKANQNVEPVEVITPAKYYFKNNRHYVLYDEFQEDKSMSKNTLIFKDDYMSVMKRGDINTHIIVESGKSNVTYYSTVAGMLHITMNGESVQISETEEEIFANAFYGLEVNYEHIADCEIRINIKSR
jgi:uncharacterized beta-barrel protein YwiB (DUF1934 family)